MRKTKVIISLLSTLLILSLALNYFQWTTIKSDEKTMQAFAARNMGLLGSDFIRANDCLNNILTGRGDKELQFERCYEVIMNASERARELPGHSHSEHSSAWYKIYRSLNKSGEALQQLNQKDQLDENDKAQLSNIKKLTDLYFDLIKKSNPNTGYIDDQTMLEAEQAAQQYLLQ